jgi:hypothetical protein
MRELLVYVADSNMAEAVAGLLARSGVHYAIGCAPFAFDARTDIKIATGQNDPGVYTRANLLMRPFFQEYRRAVVIIDEEWEGSPGAEQIAYVLRQHLDEAGWEGELGLPLVVSPEADTWLWTRTDHTAKALGWEGWIALEKELAQEGWWDAEQPKPPKPKEAAEWALRRGSKRIPRSSRLYRQVAGSVSLTRCEDPALLAFLAQLRLWFPLEK